jgi:hypothetical protein
MAVVYCAHSRVARPNRRGANSAPRSSNKTQAIPVMVTLNLKQLQVKRAGMAERAAALMELHFPGDYGVWVWKRKVNQGFTTLPRTLPLAMEAIDHRSKGQPCGHTLFCLWARAPDSALVVIENPATFAAEAGFTGARAVDTWRRRMKVLRDHYFLLSKKGASGDFHYVLLLNPNAAVDWMRRQGWVQDDLFGRFRDRLIEVGGAGELTALDAHYVAQAQAAQAAAAAAVPPPPPPSNEGGAETPTTEAVAVSGETEEPAT